MRPTTEDLLRLRDGEPVSATLAARLDDPAVRVEVQRLAQRQLELKALPQLQPPAGGWEQVRDRVVAQANASHRGSAAWHWPARLAVAASVALVAVLVISQVPQRLPVSQPPATTVTADATRNPGGAPMVNPSYASLAAESRRLEGMLSDLGYRPRVTRAGTASTIAELEDRIALVDYQLVEMGSRLTPRQRSVLWQQRVDLMNSLVKVRYAQIQGDQF